MSTNSSSSPDSLYKRFSFLPRFDDAKLYDWTFDSVEGVAKSCGVIFGSFIFFRVLQFLVRFYLFHRCTFRTFSYFNLRGRRRQTVAASTELEAIPPNKKWRISNEAVSLIHSAISGIWALYSIVTYDMTSSMITFTHFVPKFLVFVSFGYIVHDLIDLLINERSVRILELLFHHLMVVGAFLVTLLTNRYLGVVVFGLLMEINSIFLHSRSLMNLYRQPKNSTAFKFVALLNLMTYLIFRVAVSIYLIYFWATSLEKIHWSHSLMNGVIIFSLAATNGVLLYRVLAADGLLGAKQQTCQTNVEAPELKAASSPSSSDAESGDEEDVNLERSASKSHASPHRLPTTVSSTQTTDNAI